VAKVEERLAVNKRGSHKIHMKRFNLKELNELEGKEKYSIAISNRFTHLEDLDAEVLVTSVWETIRENINISTKNILGYYKVKHKL
jgi:hypothetical protein